MAPNKLIGSLLCVLALACADVCPYKDYYPHNPPCAAGFYSVSVDYFEGQCFQQTFNCPSGTKCYRNTTNTYSCAKYIGSPCTSNSNCVQNAECVSSKCQCKNINLPGLGQTCYGGCAPGLLCSIFMSIPGLPMPTVGTCLVPAGSACKTTSDCYRSEAGRYVASCTDCMCTNSPRRCKSFEEVVKVKKEYDFCMQQYYTIEGDGWGGSSQSYCAVNQISNCCEFASNQCAYILEGLRDTNFANNNVVNEIKACTSGLTKCAPNELNSCIADACGIPRDVVKTTLY